MTTTDRRWANAFRRAAEVDAGARAVARDRWAVESATNPGTVYLVEFTPEGMRCGCAAGALGLPCHHKARVLALFPEADRAAHMEPHGAA